LHRIGVTFEHEFNQVYGEENHVEKVENILKSIFILPRFGCEQYSIEKDDKHDKVSECCGISDEIDVSVEPFCGADLV
jgi:hypothetical protein